MALFAIGDTHLSFAVNKPMEVFGGAWVDYVEKLKKGFQVVGEEDTVVLCGDLSWGMNFDEIREDFHFLDELPGKKKLLLKGNHDYWWATAAKMNRFFQEEGLSTMELLHNNCIPYGEVALCGTRGWFLDEEQKPHNEKVFRRELIRLEASLQAAGEREKLCFFHYPPLYQGYCCQEIVDLLEKYQVKACYYGHLHGGSHRLAIEGKQGNVEYHLVAADYLNFVPKKILE
jgi:predicted phosphohydrolase